MNRRLTQILSLLLAVVLQIAPLVRSMLPTLTRGFAPSGWAIIFRWTVGALGAFGCHAVSKASSIAISPPNATNGLPYVGTVTYSGTHAGSVSSMRLTNSCLGSTALLPGLTITYAGGNTASVSGTPTVTGNLPFQLKIYDATSCGSGDTDTRVATLAIGGTAGVAPSFSTTPDSGMAQIGSDVLMSAVASGTPAPYYRWYLGFPSPATLVSTNSSLAFTNIQFPSAGLYTVTASNGVGSVASATAYLSVCVTPGSNILAFHTTNYATVSNAVILSSYITNAPSGSNVYKYQYNYVDVTSYSTSGSNLTIAPNFAFAGRSGTYSVVFNGVVGATTVVNQQAYDSYWAFGVKPVIGASPQSTNVLAGTNVTLTASATVQQNPYGNSLAVGFLWYRNGTNLVAVQANSGTNQTSNLSFANVDPTNAGNYTVVVTNFWGSTTSSPAALTVTSPSVPPLISPQLVAGGGSFQLAFTNNAGATFTVLGATNVSLPASNWTVLGNATEISPGHYRFTDPGVLTNAERYYRVRSP